MIFVTILATDCFNLNSSAKYSAQHQIIEFTAITSHELVGQVKDLCQNIINHQTFELFVYLGNISFYVSGLTYNYSSKIIVELYCRTPVTCDHQSVLPVQTAIYRMQFPDLDLTLESIINVYEIQVYAHADCIRQVEGKYNLINKSVNITFIDKPAQCPCSMKYSPKNGIKPLNKNVFITNFINRSAILTNSYSSTNRTGSIFQFYDDNNNKNSQFWENLKGLGPYTTRNLPVIGVLLNTLVETPILSLQMHIKVLTEIIQSSIVQTSNSVVKQNSSYYYNQTLSFFVTSITDVNSPDCYSGVRLEMHKKFFILITDVNRSATKCTIEYVENQLNMKIEYIGLQIIISQNEDKSGFNYQNTYNISNYTLGQDLEQRLNCTNEIDCEQFILINELLAHQSNTSVQLRIVFQNNNKTKMVAQYTVDFIASLYTPSNISLFSDQLCIQFDPQRSGSSDVIIRIYGYEFELAQYMTKTNKLYCESLIGDTLANIAFVITKMKGNAPVTLFVSMKVDKDVVGEVNVMVYQVPEENIIILYFILIISIISIIIAVLFSFLCKNAHAF